MGCVVFCFKMETCSTCRITLSLLSLCISFHLSSLFFVFTVMYFSFYFLVLFSCQCSISFILQVVVGRSLLPRLPAHGNWAVNTVEMLHQCFAGQGGEVVFFFFFKRLFPHQNEL